METNQATSSDDQKPSNMEIDTPDFLSTHTGNLNKYSASDIAIDLSNVCKDRTDQCDTIHSSKIEISNINQSGTDDMDHTDITTSNLIEPISISDHIKDMKGLEINQMKINIVDDVKILSHSKTDSINIEVSNKQSDANTDVEQENMSLEQLNLIQQSLANLTQTHNSPEKLGQPANIKKFDQPVTISEKSDQTIPANLVQPSKSTGNLNQTSIISENVVQPISLHGNLEMIQPNADESMDLASMSNAVIDQLISDTAKLDQQFVIPQHLYSTDEPSTSTGNVDRNCGTLKMLHKLGTSVEKLDQPNTNQENSRNQASVSQMEIKQLESKEEKIKLFAEDKGPHWHDVVNNLVTLPVIATNLPKVFKNFPIFEKPENSADIENFYDRQIRNFVGCDLSDAEFEELQDYCSIDNLRTGKEFTMNTKIPQVGCWIQAGSSSLDSMPHTGDTPDLFVLRKLKARMERDPRNLYAKKLKYRGVRMLPMSSQEEQSGIAATEPPDLEPGKDLLYRIRVYRPFMFSTPRAKAQIRGRHSVFSCDVVVCGRQPLTALRDRLVCRNDADLRLDVSRRPHDRAPTTAKEMFPSGFLFINNVFYVDNRPGCTDTSAVVRAWAAQRGMGKFPVQDMGAVTLQDINVRLAHPEVYVHQGNCEHLFLFTEIRLLNYSDPLHLASYPCHTAVSHNQTLYCTTCAEFGAKWIVTGCERVPFDPAFFCEICFKQYLYADGKKKANFKACAYKGNELSILKPQS